MTAASDLSDGLSSTLEDLRLSISDAEAAHAKGHLKQATRDDVVELTLVRAMGLFEEFLGDLFMLAMEGNHGVDSQPLVTVGSRAEAVLFVSGVDQSGAEKYISWLPFKDKTLGRASRLLTNGLPFARLANRPTEKTALGDFVKVRNRIAHDSASAREKFESLARQKGYPHSRAADYLTSVRGSDTEIILSLARLEAITKGLAAASDAESRIYLDPEGPFSPSTVAPPGAYLCNRFSHRIESTDFKTLGTCRNCPRPVKCSHCGRIETVVSEWIRES